MMLLQELPAVRTESANFNGFPCFFKASCRTGTGTDTASVTAVDPSGGYFYLPSPAS